LRFKAVGEGIETRRSRHQELWGAPKYRSFFELRKDADADLPILIEAKQRLELVK